MTRTEPDRGPAVLAPGELLTVAAVPVYLAAVPALARAVDPSALASVVEVGDGNLNLVFVVTDTSGRSLVLKQSLPHVRTDPSWPMTRERSAREARILAAHRAVDPEHVPELLHFDPAAQVLAIEDLSDHVVWRVALDGGDLHAEAAVDLGVYAARAGFGTSVLALGTAGHKAAVAAAMNPELSEITEDLVLTEPFVEHPHNVVLPANAADVAALAADPEVQAAVGRAKWAFMTRAEVLLHGDLHTGSVFVRAAAGGAPRSTRAFDAEFGAYGPLGFDVGMLWGNLVLAAARATARGQDARAAELLGLPAATWAAFEAEWRRLWPSRTDPRVFGDAVLEDLLARARADATAYAGAEVARRVIGFAKVSDVETLPEALREGAVRGALRAARELLLAAGRGRTDPAALSAVTGELLTAAATR
ncbi:S-methyl-5-thioribose kinase [Trujillonella endophytica]|uniref:5'-methylthioribose kinase n=1 Tax=Trujillonella endophytica TaxID=673521 RepID=A0A1H8WNC9_9ACTN|nr:S-methyl-5-thioribose kinase [Trujillella endophytica]SEP29190.1 5'-methylthioribose kinase [Trujillella endophytica]